MTAGVSRALRWMVAHDYELASLDDQMQAAATIAPHASKADHVRLSLLELLLPELVSAVESVIVASGHNEGARGMAGGLLTYVCNPLDIIGDDLPLGRVDDVLVCALGLKRLEELGFELPGRSAAACEVAIGCLPWLRKDVREGVAEFVASLQRRTVTADLPRAG